MTGVIVETAEVTEEVANDIRMVLEDRELFEWFGSDENPFDEEAHFDGKAADDADYRESWQHLVDSLTTEARFFNPTAEAILSDTFTNIDKHRTDQGMPIIIEAGPKTKLTAFFRARVFQANDQLEEALKRPDLEVGPPPARAASHGRMNPHGVSVFYGATDPMVALAEVRPPVGSRVIVGRFEILRPLRLLDIKALRSVDRSGSIFDRKCIERLRKATFLDWLSDRITQPVMPNDEPFEYLPTQAIADFLAARSATELDGIIYPSVQGEKDGANVVLFHKSARVRALEIPPKAARFRLISMTIPKKAFKRFTHTHITQFMKRYPQLPSGPIFLSAPSRILMIRFWSGRLTLTNWNPTIAKKLYNSTEKALRCIT